MGIFILRRLISLGIVMVGVSFIAFFFVHLIPGDPAQAMLGEQATPENVARVREALGLDQPLHLQYARFVGRLLQGDLGQSLHTSNPIAVEFASRFPATVELSVAALLLALVVGVPAGVIAAVRRNSIFDLVSMSVALIGISMPIYWLGLMLIWFLAIQLAWLPPGGRLHLEIELSQITNFYTVDALLAGDLAALRSALAHLALPAIALSTVPMAIIARMTRASVIDVLGQDFIRTAHAKGLSERAVVIRHALKNAALPVVTVIGLSTGRLLSGAVLTESIFSWPGIGRWIFDAIGWRDYPVIQVMILLIAAMFVIINLVVDLLYAALDPRIRLW
jgi:peptide/nickel transport system permease protein